MSQSQVLEVDPGHRELHMSLRATHLIPVKAITVMILVAES